MTLSQNNCCVHVFRQYYLVWEFELNWFSKLRENNKRKITLVSCHTKVCAFRCLISIPQNLIMWSRNQNRGKLLLSWKLRYFRGSRFSQCLYITINLSPLLFTKWGFMLIVILSNYKVSTAFKQTLQLKNYPLSKNEDTSPCSHNLYTFLCDLVFWLVTLFWLA